MKALILLTIPVLMLLSCGFTQNDPEEVVRDYYRAMDEEDVELYMSTVSGPRADVAGLYLDKFFADYDITYTIDTLFTLSKVGKEAQVLCVVTAKNEGGPKKFTDNRITVLSKLRLDRGIWTIYNAETSEPIKLDENGNAIEDAKTDKDSLLWQLSIPIKE